MLTLLNKEIKNKFDVNYASLAKGDYVTPEQIESITGTQQGTTRFQTAILRLKAEMEKNFKHLGLDAVIKQENYGLLICSDTRAADYTWNRFTSHLKGAAKQTDDMRHKVDTTNFTSKEKADYYNRLQIATEVTEGAIKTKKKIIGLQSNMERASLVSNNTAVQLNQAA